jgi:hypothetical protein
VCHDSKQNQKKKEKKKENGEPFQGKISSWSFLTKAKDNKPLYLFKKSVWLKGLNTYQLPEF